MLSIENRIDKNEQKSRLTNDKKLNGNNKKLTIIKKECEDLLIFKLKLDMKLI